MAESSDEFSPKSNEELNESNKSNRNIKDNNIISKYLVNFKKRGSRNERRFFEHDTRNSNRRNIRSSISTSLNEENARFEPVRGRNAPRRRPMGRPPNSDSNRMLPFARTGQQLIYPPNINRLKKKLLRKQNRLRKQLDALQTQSKFANMVTSSCCCKCGWLSMNDANVCPSALIKQTNPALLAHGKFSGIPEATVCAESTLQSIIRYIPSDDSGFWRLAMSFRLFYICGASLY